MSRQPAQEWEGAVEELCRNIKEQQGKFPNNIMILAGDFNCEWPQWQDVCEECQGDNRDMESYTLGLKLHELGFKAPAIKVENTEKQQQGGYIPENKPPKMYDQTWMPSTTLGTASGRRDGEVPTGLCATSCGRASSVARFAPQAPSFRGWTPSRAACARLARDWAEWSPQSMAEVQTSGQDISVREPEIFERR